MRHQPEPLAGEVSALTRYARVVKLSSALVLCLFACGGASLPTGPAPVPLDEWCEVVTERLCEQMADACMNGMQAAADGCMDTGVPACIAGRDASGPSGHTYDDLNECVSTVESLGCAELGTAIGQMAFDQGPLQRCSIADPSP